MIVLTSGQEIMKESVVSHSLSDCAIPGEISLMCHEVPQAAHCRVYVENI